MRRCLKMRERILTESEKKALEEFLENGKSSVIIRMLRYRARKFLPILIEEIVLLEQLSK